MREPLANFLVYEYHTNVSGTHNPGPIPPLSTPQCPVLVILSHPGTNVVDEVRLERPLSFKSSILVGPILPSISLLRINIHLSFYTQASLRMYYIQPIKPEQTSSMGPKKDTEAAKKAATKKTAVTPSKKTTIEISSKEPSEVSDSLMCLSKRDERWLTKVQKNDEAPKKTKPTKKVGANRALAANKKDSKHRRNSDSKHEREDRDERRTKKQKQNKYRVEDCEEYPLRNHQGYCETYGPGWEDDQTIYRSDEEPAEKTCLEKGCYQKAAKDGLFKTHAKDKNQGTLDVGTDKVAFGFGCQAEGCGRFSPNATPGWCKTHGPNAKPGDGGSNDDDLPKETARKPVSNAPKASPKAASKTRKAPTSDATRDDKCQRTTLANKMCTRNAVSGGKYCAQHQKPRKTAPRNNDDYMDSEDDSDQDVDKDNGKNKAPTSAIASPKKTATNSAPTKAPAKKAAPTKAPARKPAAKNKVVGGDGTCGITTGNWTACKRIPPAGQDYCFQHRKGTKVVEEVTEESTRMFGEMENKMIMLEATIIEEGSLVDDELDDETTIHDIVVESGYVSA